MIMYISKSLITKILVILCPIILVDTHCHDRKLGTITPNGGDVFSYDEDDMVIDSNLSIHLFTVLE